MHKVTSEPQFWIRNYYVSLKWPNSSSSVVGILNLALAKPPVPPVCVLDSGHFRLPRYVSYPELRF
jgi:hypothetical protein